MADAARPIRQPEWATGELDLAAYLERIGHPGPVAATGSVLRALLEPLPRGETGWRRHGGGPTG